MIPALSVRMPWAWLVFHGKTIENRDWDTGYRGRFQVQATNTNLRDEYAAAQRLIETHRLEIQLPSQTELKELAGHLLGTVFLERTSPPTIIETDDPDLQGYFYPWGNPNSKFWWHLSRPIPWTPEPCKGQLGWFFPI